MPLGTEKTALLGASAGGALSEVELLVVAAGGGGGSNGGGGGGAGGYRTSAAYAIEIGVDIAVVAGSGANQFGTITSSPGFIPTAINANIKAVVPLDVATTCGTPRYSPIACSN